MIWVGTDDGNVQVTQDDGATWTNVVASILDVELPDAPDADERESQALPAATWVPHVEASPFEAGEAFVAFDDHRRGNWTPYIFHTRDFGQTWRALGRDGLEGFVHVVEQDPVEANLLFAGTEFGLFVSFDRGEHWQKWSHGIPTVPVRDLVIHPRDHDLVIGTHGRALLVLDDIRPLRAIAADPAILAADLHAFEPPPAFQHEQAEPLGYRSTGDAMFFGENRPYGALLTFWLGAGVTMTEDGGAGADSTTRVTIDILDGAGAVVRTMTHEAAPGINRVVWDLETTGFRSPGQRETPSGGGPQVVPGEYGVRIRTGDAEATTRVTVRFDPRSTITLADRRAQYEEARRLGEVSERAADAVDRLDEVADALELVRDRIAGDEHAALRAAADSLDARLDALHERFTGPSGRQGIVDSDAAVMSRVRDAYRRVSRSFSAPTPTHRTVARQAESALDAAAADLDAFLTGEVAAFGERVRAAGLSLWPLSGPGRG